MAFLKNQWIKDSQMFGLAQAYWFEYREFCRILNSQEGQTNGTFFVLKAFIWSRDGRLLEVVANTNVLAIIYQQTTVHSYIL